jgi:hypothetical protein
MPVILSARSHGVLRHSGRDAVLIVLSMVYAGLLLTVPSILLIAFGLWWIANTVAHNFIHTPFFASRPLNRAFSMYLSALMGFPQELWRERHLRHHRGDGRPVRMTPELLVDSVVVLAAWVGIAAASPRSFALVYMPGYCAGLGLCLIQGHFEHTGGTTSHYGRLYNWRFFNDGSHVEHHRGPGVHWTELPRERAGAARCSRWPPVLRWLDVLTLEYLERVALKSPTVQRYVLAAHEQAFQRLLPAVPSVSRVTIVGGGLFPRTALILRKLKPDAALTIIDAQRHHLELARPFLPKGMELREQFFDTSADDGADLVVIPLSFIGDRRNIYRHPPAPATLVHDWVWNTQGEGARVSWLLLKRLNLVTR